jgi:hypothetical protein
MPIKIEDETSTELLRTTHEKIIGRQNLADGVFLEFGATNGECKQLNLDRAQ